jgi:hypothetical protein
VVAQALDNDEQINVRWAYDDPNPRAQAVQLRDNAKVMLEAMERRGDLAVLAGVEPYSEAMVSAANDCFDGENEPAAKRHASCAQPDLTPMTRTQHAAVMQAQAAAEAEAFAEAERQREIELETSNRSRLDDILQGIAASTSAGDAQHGRDKVPLSRSILLFSLFSRQFSVVNVFTPSHLFPTRPQLVLSQSLILHRYPRI